MKTGLLHLRKPAWTLLLFYLVFRPALAWETQANLSSYYDSNPRENIERREPTFGLKARGLLRFDKTSPSGRLFGSILGQGFIEPALFLDSKVILNSELGGSYQLFQGYRFRSVLTTFQKLYFEDFQRTARTTLSGSIKRHKSRVRQQELGLRRSDFRIDFGTLFHYVDHRVFLNLTRQIGADFQAELSTQIGRIDYQDYPARILRGDSLSLSPLEDQQDNTQMLGLHVKHMGKVIWGVAINFENIRSNSAIEEAQVWSMKLYASGRLSEQLFFHIVLNGMKKGYAHTDFFEATPYRDPEENIQNQFHVQLERVVHPSRVLYIQYSYIKNETVFNHWFYDKNLIETGVKLTF